MTDEVEMIEVIDQAKIGTKGFPRHYAALGLDPPMKMVPKEKPPEPAPEPDPNAVPDAVSAAQARLALLNAGLLDAV